VMSLGLSRHYGSTGTKASYRFLRVLSPMKATSRGLNSRA
jgi:hypothetical protein